MHSIQVYKETGHVSGARIKSARESRRGILPLSSSREMSTLADPSRDLQNGRFEDRAAEPLAMRKMSLPGKIPVTPLEVERLELQPQPEVSRLSVEQPPREHLQLEFPVVEVGNPPGSGFGRIGTDMVEARGEMVQFQPPAPENLVVPPGAAGRREAVQTVFEKLDVIKPELLSGKRVVVSAENGGVSGQKPTVAVIPNENLGRDLRAREKAGRVMKRLSSALAEVENLGPDWADSQMAILESIEEKQLVLNSGDLEPPEKRQVKADISSLERQVKRPFEDLSHQVGEFLDIFDIVPAVPISPSRLPAAENMPRQKDIEALKEKEPGEENGSIGKQRLSLGAKIGCGLVIAATVAGCAAPPPPPKITSRETAVVATQERPPERLTETPKPTETLEPTKETTPTVFLQATKRAEGPILKGRSLQVGGTSLSLIEKEGLSLSERINPAGNKAWKVITNSEGNAICFMGEDKGEQIVIIPMAPKGYQWDTKAGVWFKKDDESQGLVSDIALPGYYDEETGQAGPLVRADFVGLVDINGEIKSFVLYSPKRVEYMIDQLGVDPETQGMQLLPDGGAVFLGSAQKEFNLPQGWTIERDPETGTLYQVDADGVRQKKMVVRWPEVNSPEEAKQIGSWQVVKSPAYWNLIDQLEGNENFSRFGMRYDYEMDTYIREDQDLGIMVEFYDHQRGWQDAFTELGVSPLTGREKEGGEEPKFLFVNEKGDSEEAEAKDEVSGPRYIELAQETPISDFRQINSVEKLENELSLIYDQIDNEEVNHSVRSLELFIASSSLESFEKSQVSSVGWANRHVGAMNGLLAENDLDLRLRLKRVFLINDELAESLNWRFWQKREPYLEPPDVYNRWVMTGGDYREVSAYYNKKYDLDMGLLHEWSHYFLNLWDTYFLNFYPSEEDKVVIKSISGGKKVINPQEASFPANWLTVGSHERPYIGPHSREAILHFQELGISSWGDAWDYWTEEAFKDLADEFGVAFIDSKGNEVQGKVSLYIAEVNGVSPGGFTLLRDYPSQPDKVYNQIRGKFCLPEEVKGYSYSYYVQERDPLADSDSIIGFGKNFLIVLETLSGEMHQFPLTSYDLWLASRRSPSSKFAYLSLKVK